MPDKKMKEGFSANMETGCPKKQLIVNMNYFGPQSIVKIFRHFKSQLLHRQSAGNPNYHYYLVFRSVSQDLLSPEKHIELKHLYPNNNIFYWIFLNPAHWNIVLLLNSGLFIYEDCPVFIISVFWTGYFYSMLTCFRIYTLTLYLYPELILSPAAMVQMAHP